MTIEDINEQITDCCNNLANTQKFIDSHLTDDKNILLDFLKSDLNNLKELLENIELSIKIDKNAK